MSAAQTGCCGCPDVTEIVEIPGVQGINGTNGTDGSPGIDAFSLTSTIFTVPAKGATVTVFMDSSEWMTPSQVVYITNAGYFSVVSKAGTTSALLTYLNINANVAAGNAIAANSTVSPAGPPITVTGLIPAALTDNTTGVASNTLAAGVGRFTLSIPIVLASVAGNGDILTNYLLGFAFKILTVDCRVVTPATTVSRSFAINLEIGTTNLTGGVVSLTTANCTTLGAAIAGTAVTAANTGTAADTLSVEAASVTAFAEGEVVLLVCVQNMDTAGAVASLAAKTNALTTAIS